MSIIPRVSPTFVQLILYFPFVNKSELGELELRKRNSIAKEEVNQEARPHIAKQDCWGGGVGSPLAGAKKCSDDALVTQNP